MLRWCLILGSTCLIGAGAAYILNGSVRQQEGEAEAADGRTVKGARREQQAVAVTVAPVTPRRIQRAVKIVGTFNGLEEVDVETKINGRIVKIAHDIGDVVRPGDVLLEIEATDYRLAVAEAQRSMELELAKLGLQAPPDKDFDVNTLPTIVRAAQEEKNAKSKLTRRRNLKQFTTAEDLDQIETDFKIAEANHQQAVLEASATLAAVRQRQAVLDTALDRLSETSICVPEPSVDRLQDVMQAARAAGLKQDELPPVEYVVSERLVSEGEMLHAASGAAVFHLVMDRPLKLLATVPERHVGEVRIGQRVEVAVEAYPADTFQGVVSRINPTIDRASRTFKLEVLVANPDRRLKAGSFAKASVMTREDAQAPTIPEEALISFAGVTKVFVIKGGQARAVDVQPGVRLEVQGPKRLENWVEVAGDLPPDSEVVTSGQTQLADGTIVRLRSDALDAPGVAPSEQVRSAGQVGSSEQGRTQPR